jgi:hypothetical protein
MFKNLTIKTKLLLQVSVALLGAFLLSIILINTNLNTVNELKSVEKNSQLINSISLLIHETQKERGITAGFIGSKGKIFGNKLPIQRSLTDKKISDIKHLLSDLNDD